MNLSTLFPKAQNLEKLSPAEALQILTTPDENLEELLTYANQLREKFFGQEVVLCGIVNAKSGHCSEDCSFCAQSGHNRAEVNTYQLLNKNQLLESAQKAREAGVGCFSLVTAGKGLSNEKDFQVILATIPEIKKSGLNRCVSLGILSKDQLKELKAAGLNKLHHNLECAESFFPKMCTTHTYQERVETIKNAKAVGLEVCCGGIFGIGETPEQRVELALAIRELEVSSVPINILHAIEGTRIKQAQLPKMRWQDILKLIAMFRFVLPNKTIGVFGGREKNLGEHQPLIFRAGANSILIGNYLTTKGAEITQDLAMLKTAGLTAKQV